MDIADATLAFFRELVSETFSVDLGEVDSLDLELVAAESLRSGPEGLDADRSFTLEFRGASEPELAQGTFTVAHAELRPGPMFLVPVMRTDEGMRYQAVFNRLA